jgi:phosphate transport system protein
MLEQKIKDLKKDIMLYAVLVESMVAKSIKGLQAQDKDLLTEVIYYDEPQANEFDIHMDEQCTNTIAQFQPQARDLRTILMILKMSTDLERLGDSAVSICRRGLFLVENSIFKMSPLFYQLATAALNMLHDSILAFTDEDSVAALNIVKRDAQVDELRNRIMEELKETTRSQPQTIDINLNLMDIARKLERVADLSTNICEEIIFMVQGRVIKHHKED